MNDRRTCADEINSRRFLLAQSEPFPAVATGSMGDGAMTADSISDRGAVTAGEREQIETCLNLLGRAL